MTMAWDTISIAAAGLSATRFSDYAAQWHFYERRRDRVLSGDGSTHIANPASEALATLWRLRACWPGVLIDSAVEGSARKQPAPSEME